jgi:hypothetical protein
LEIQIQIENRKNEKETEKGKRKRGLPGRSEQPRRSPRSSPAPPP